MCPIIVVVADVLVHESFQMVFVEYDDMIEQIAAAVTFLPVCAGRPLTRIR